MSHDSTSTPDPSSPRAQAGAAPRGEGDLGLAGAGTELVMLLLQSSGVEKLLADLADVTARTLAVSCSVTAHHNGRPVTAASSDRRATAVDEEQYALGDGPCLETLASGRSITVSDVAVPGRWEGYRHRALTHGVRSSLSVPLTADGVVVGSLNLYAGPSGTFDDPRCVARATTLAAQAGAVIAVAVRQAERTQLIGQLQEALASRSTIDQAIGILMDQQRCDAETAFALLRTASQSRNRKLRDIAADLVASVGEGPRSARPDG